jgi:hypothetical protein
VKSVSGVVAMIPFGSPGLGESNDGEGAPGGALASLSTVVRAPYFLQILEKSNW